MDTAPNYCHGCVHLLLAPVLAESSLVGIAAGTGVLTAVTAQSAHAAAVVAAPEVRHSIAAHTAHL
ncbi:hypothetical protein ACFU9Y_10680 [Streptomyces sp. NPDC057621]|uniref:hypothetical protein n=1 Tax=Streptomyces sp. NPDC057621 TaxID=3346186 RepID=UPI0036B9D661